MAKQGIILVYITAKDKKEARKVATHLLKRKLIACANIFPIESMYWWKGEIKDAKEAVLIAKATSKHYAAIKKEVKKIHSYTIPCIMKIGAGANDEYAKWIMGELR